MPPIPKQETAAATLLEYVAEHHLGPPVTRSAGRASWPCPQCDHRSFGTLPPHPSYKNRFRCFRCGWWGDEYDLLRHFYPGEKWPRLQVRLDQLRREYEAATKVQPSTFPSGDRGDSTTMQPTAEHRNDPRDVAAAWAGLMDLFRDEETGEAFALQIVTETVEACDRYDVSITALLDYWRGFDRWIRETDKLHLEECDDPECDAVVCRAERGLPPLTREEIERN